jgi:hypothetical protein
VLYLRLIILSVRGDIPVNSEAILVTDFINLKINPIQFFECAHRDRMYVYIFIGINDNIYVCIVFLKK